MQPFTRVVLTRDVPEERLRAGDVGTVVEVYDDASGNTVGYEIETFAVSGETFTVASVPTDAIRQVTSADRLAARAG